MNTTMTHPDGQTMDKPRHQITRVNGIFISNRVKLTRRLSTGLPFNGLWTFLLIAFLMLFFSPVQGQKDIKRQKEKPVAVYTYNEYGVGSGFSYWDYGEERGLLSSESMFTIGGQFTHARIRSNKATRIFEFGINYLNQKRAYSGSVTIDHDRPHDRSVDVGLLYGSHRNKLGYRVGILYSNISLGLFPIAKVIFGRPHKVFFELGLGDQLLYGISRSWADARLGFNLTGGNPNNKPQAIIFGGGVALEYPIMYFEGNFTILDEISIRPAIVYAMPFEIYKQFFISISYRPAYDRKKAMGFLEQ